jgi:hypothetical protein
MGSSRVQGLTPFTDGFLTSRGTFQKYFSPHELRALVRDALDAEPVAVAPGIVFLFRDPEAEQEFLFRRRTRHAPAEIVFAQSPRPRMDRAAVPLPERLRPVLEQLWARAVQLGRAPEAEESPRTPIQARSSIAASEAGQMAASDYVPIFFKNRLHLVGRPQMGSRPSLPSCGGHGYQTGPAVHAGKPPSAEGPRSGQMDWTGHASWRSVA